MNLRKLTACILSIVVLSAVPAHAEGPTVQLTISGPGLDAPLHTSEESVLSANVWSGNYVDWGAGPQDTAEDEALDYHVHFWVRPPEGPIQISYFLRYRWDDEANRAILCIPGRRDVWHGLNVASVYRGNEGGCFYAKEEWGAAVRAALTGEE
ncbi:MAG: hypothetical protein AAFX56_05205 [Pseudomonadota bacterium]